MGGRADLVCSRWISLPGHFERSYGPLEWQQTLVLLTLLYHTGQDDGAALGECLVGVRCLNS